MRIALVTDTHFGGKSDSEVFAKYIGKFYNDIFFPYLKKENITQIIHLGDIVDRRKFINFSTARHMHDTFIKPIVDMNIKADLIIGNHDTYFKNTNDINSMRELYGHTTYNNLSYFDKSTIREYDGTEILLQPWICASNYEESIKIVRETSAQILFGHLEIQGFMMYRDGLACQNGLTPEMFSRFDVVCSGHFHHRSKMENIQYLGCPYEMTWSDYNDNKGFHVFDTEKRTLTFIQNPYRLFHKIIYDDSKMSLTDVMNKDYSFYTDTYVKVIISSKNNPYMLDKLLDNLYQANPHNVAIVDDHKNINEQTDEEIGVDAEDTLTVLRKYVSDIDISDNEKYLVKAEIDNLYHRAQNMEI